MSYNCKNYTAHGGNETVIGGKLTFLPGAEIEGGEGLFGGVSAGGNGWDVGFFWAGIPVLLGIAMIVVVAIRAKCCLMKLRI